MFISVGSNFTQIACVQNAYGVPKIDYQLAVLNREMKTNTDVIGGLLRLKLIAQQVIINTGIILSVSA